MTDQQSIEASDQRTRNSVLGVHHVAMATTNIEAQQRFYCDLFGMTLLTTGEWKDVPEYDALVGLPQSSARFSLLAAGNLALELFQYFTPEPGPAELDRPVNKPGITHLCFAVGDLDAEFERLSNAGVRFHAPPTQAEDDASLRAVYGRDPEGNVFELLEFRGDTPFDYAPSWQGWRKG